MTSDTTNNGNPERKPRKGRVAYRLKMMMPLTFRGQAVLFLFPLIVIISGVYTIESIWTERRILRREMIKNGKTVAAMASRNSEQSLLSENIGQLKGSALSVMAIKDVAFVSFYNKHSQFLYHEGMRHHASKKLTWNPDSSIRFEEHSEFFEFIVPVVTGKATEGLLMYEGSGSAPPAKEHLGWVCIGLSKEVMHGAERQILIRSSILAVLFSVAGVLLLYIFVTFITRPFYTIFNAVKGLREGEHAEITVESPRSEMGRLSTEVNRMSDAIREREEALQENVMELVQTQEQLQENVLELEMQVQARQEIEAELIKHRDHLEELVKERTEELTIAKDQAEAASRSKSDFLASMSHELRTPLNAILGYAQILKHHENLTEAQRQQLDIMHGSGEHLLMLINDILDVGKIEAQKMELDEVVFDLPALVRQVFNLTKVHAAEKELRFEYQAGTLLPSYVRGDERKLRQILLNLLSNSVKYTRRGGVAMRVSYDLAGARLFRCEIVDSGIGIPADKLEAIFDPFTQLLTDRQVTVGSGLGLNITKHLLELMHGRMGVESVLGKGSTFWIEVCLPALVDSEVVHHKPDSRVVCYSGHRRRILVVDDNIGNTSMLVSLLEPLGFLLCTAQNGHEALQRAEEHRPDLVLMDLVMPEMNGLEAATLMRDDQGLAGTKIIGASATVTDNDEKERFVAICDDFVIKPICIDLLLEKIGRQLGIEWETAPAETESIESGPIAAMGQDPVVPGAEEMERLYELAMMGDMKEIAAWATGLATGNDTFSRFAEKVRDMAGGFKTKAILALAEQHRGDRT